MTTNVQVLPGSGSKAAATSATITAITAAPSGASAGISVAGYSQLAWSFHSFDAVTAWTVALYVYDGVEWAQALDSAGAVLEIEGTTNTGAQVFNIAGFERAYMRVTAWTGTEAIQTLRAVGPGL